MTQFQMLQFVFMVVHGSLMLWWDCPYPKRVTMQYVGYILLMLALFANFYIQKHLCGKKGKNASDKQKGGALTKAE